MSVRSIDERKLLTNWHLITHLPHPAGLLSGPFIEHLVGDRLHCTEDGYSFGGSPGDERWKVRLLGRGHAR
jgi:hypothetical protein